MKKDTPISNKVSRRDLLKGTAALPIIGAIGSVAWTEANSKNKIKTNRFRLDYKFDDSNLNPPVKNGETLRLGIIGSGGRGQYLLRAAGLAHPKVLDSWIEEEKKNPKNRRYSDFLEQDDLNIRLTAVCDVFDDYAQYAIEAGANNRRQGSNGPMGTAPKRYKSYIDLLNSGKVDAIINATTDHWHAQITIDAAQRGIHVYCEKPMTWQIQETFALRQAVKGSGIAFQLGHQGRQTPSYNKAKKMYEDGVIGKVNLVEVTTNRNSPEGAWVYDLPKNATPETVDWEQWLGRAPKCPFDVKRFRRWRCWWDYSTGLSGDLLTHEFDAMNQILSLGIPQTAMSSGGIYFFKDGRTVPDVLTTSFEYTESDLTLLYSSSLASNKERGKVIMGHDGYMEVGGTLSVYADRESTVYHDVIQNKKLNPSDPIFTYVPGADVDAIATATEQYFAQRGLFYSVINGTRIDTTHLHIKEWINAIRSGKKDKTMATSCNIDAGFEEAIAAHMGTVSYLSGQKTHWDAANEKIFTADGNEVPEIIIPNKFLPHNVEVKDYKSYTSKGLN